MAMLFAGSVALHFSLLVLLVHGVSAQTHQNFTCSLRSKCQALAGYRPPTETTYQAIRTLFQVDSIYDLYGANGLNETTPSSSKVPANTTVRIPFPCSCSNGIGASDWKPIYAAKKGDSLESIARVTFGGLVTDQQVAAANGIANASSVVNAGQGLLIPLPCSCDMDDFGAVVHLAYVVREERTLAEIYNKFLIVEKSLLRFNDVTDPKNLTTGQVLDVPLGACSSSAIRANSPDSELLVPNGSYALTAHNCIKCTCYRPAAEMSCRLSPSLVWGERGGCIIQTCSLPSRLNNAFEFDTYYGGDCTITQCLYGGYDEREIWITTKTLRYSACEERSDSPASLTAVEMGSLLSWALLAPILLGAL